MELVHDHAQLVFPALLQTHAMSSSRLRVRQAFQDLPLFLKSAALMCRGIVVSDSDLNNNPLFFGLLEGEPVIQEALCTGFIRRAVRKQSAGPATQSAVAEAFKKSNPERYLMIPNGHPAALDRIFQSTEHRFPPFEWTGAELGALFADRLLTRTRLELARVRSQTVSDSLRTKERILLRIYDWVDNRIELEPDTRQVRVKLPVLAAQLESDLKPRFPTDVEAAEWENCFKMVLESYNGNVPIVFQGGLIQADNGISSDQLLPAGPESIDQEMKFEIDLYERAARGELAQVALRVEPGTDSEISSFMLDTRLLQEITWKRVIELREACEPERMLRLRFESLGSSTLHVTHAGELAEEALRYAQRLHVSGRIMTEAVLRPQVEQVARSSAMKKIYIRKYTEAGFVEKLMAIVSDQPTRGNEVVACDVDLLRTYDSELDLGDEDNEMLWQFRRPDYRLVKAMGASASANGPDM